MRPVIRSSQKRSLKTFWQQAAASATCSGRLSQSKIVERTGKEKSWLVQSERGVFLEPLEMANEQQGTMVILGSKTELTVKCVYVPTSRSPKSGQ